MCVSLIYYNFFIITPFAVDKLSRMDDVFWVHKKTGTIVQVLNVANVDGTRDGKVVICRVRSLNCFMRKESNSLDRSIVVPNARFLKKYDVYAH
jgi:hypothetical protein